METELTTEVREAGWGFCSGLDESGRGGCRVAVGRRGKG